jgi:hypothetical protein
MSSECQPVQNCRAVVGMGGLRFLVPKYEGAARTDYRAAQTDAARKSVSKNTGCVAA